MNDLCGCGGPRFRRLGSRLSHLRIFYKSDAPTRTTFLSSRTTPVISGYRQFSYTGVKMTEAQKKWTAPVVRKQFLDFFEKNGHTIGM